MTMTGGTSTQGWKFRRTADEEDAWGAWASAAYYAQSLSTTGTTGCNAWSNWNTTTSTTGGSGGGCNLAWAQWNRNYDKEITRAIRESHYYRQYQQEVLLAADPPPEATAERAARLARENEARNRLEMERKFRVEQVQTAKNKAEELLMSVLTDEQKGELTTKKYVTCKSRKSGNRYRIYRGTHGNVRQIDHAGKEIAQLCIQPDNVPEGDSMLAQLLHIEHNEEEFRKTANITRLVN